MLQIKTDLRRSPQQTPFLQGNIPLLVLVQRWKLESKNTNHMREIEEQREEKQEKPEKRQNHWNFLFLFQIIHHRSIFKSIMWF